MKPHSSFTGPVTRLLVGLPSSGDSWQRKTSLSLPFPEVAYIPWFVVPPSIFKVHHSNLCLHFFLSQYSDPPAAAAVAKPLHSCPTLCDPIDGSPPGSAVPGILQARTLEWVAISFSNAGKWKVKVTSLSRVWLLETPWTAAHQAPPSMGFSRQEYWSGVPLPSPASSPKGRTLVITLGLSGEFRILSLSPDTQLTTSLGEHYSAHHSCS